MAQDKQEQLQPPQEQPIPGTESEMTPAPEYDRASYKPAAKLQGKVAFITGGDSGIGRSVAVLYAREGADCAIVFNTSTDDAQETQRLVEAQGRKCVVIQGDAGREEFCKSAIEQTVQELGKLDILVNSAAEQHPQESIEDITEAQLERTFRTNIFAYFFTVKHALKHLKPGAVIINTCSITAFQGSAQLLDYASTKGAIVAFTRSLSKALIEKGIRVNSVAPGPIWTPLIVSTMPEDVPTFGSQTPMKRAGQPVEVAACYVFLASEDSSYIAGQTLHPTAAKL